MELMVQNVMLLVLQILWRCHVFFDQFTSIRVDKAKTETPARKPIIVQRVRRPKHGRTASSSSNLLLNETSTSLLKLSDVITPMEEEMIRCLCAKGNPRSTRAAKAAANVQSLNELSISRDTFTNIWLDSCWTT